MFFVSSELHGQRAIIFMKMSWSKLFTATGLSFLSNALWYLFSYPPTLETFSQVSKPFNTPAVLFHLFSFLNPNQYLISRFWVQISVYIQTDFSRFSLPTPFPLLDCELIPLSERHLHAFHHIFSLPLRYLQLCEKWHLHWYLREPSGKILRCN